MILAHDILVLGGLFGGFLIGISAVLLLAINGKIAGVSGIIGRAISNPHQSAWRWLFIAGLLSGSFFYSATHRSLDTVLSSFDEKTALAAVLVGVGTRLGAGCTSGHAVCGIGRLSTRSVVATIIFMVVAILTVTIVGR